MTDQEINIAIAEACGWNRTGNSCSGWQAPDGCSDKYPPAYYRDLNAMHVAEEKLSSREMEDYQFWLHDLSGVSFVPGACPTTPQLWTLTHATARQRAEAFLRTLGKWKD